MSPAFRALVWKDLRLFSRDRRALIMSFAAPIAIASFFGFVLGGPSKKGDIAPMPIAVVDHDQSAVSRQVISDLRGDKTIDVKILGEDEARLNVQTGDLRAAAVIPKGFGQAAMAAFFRGQHKPELRTFYDPSRLAERQMLEGILTGKVMEAVSKEVFSGETGRSTVEQSLKDVESATELNQRDREALLGILRSVQEWQRSGSGSGGLAGGGLTIPFQLKSEAVTANRGEEYNSFAHAFAGMGVQFILFMGIEAGISVLLQRQRGIWRRIRSAPVSRSMLLATRATSAALCAFFVLMVLFGFARLVFGVKVEGSVLGFLGVGMAFSLMTAALGLLVAALGHTPEATRPLAILITLVMVMLGGSWIPTFLFPAWLQTATLAVPTRWAVDGLAAMTWRGLGFSAAITPILAMLGFAALFAFVAVRRFRWDAD
ncbi:MAG: ABC transporter permease [Bryobacteraceae bacterium]